MLILSTTFSRIFISGSLLYDQQNSADIYNSQYHNHTIPESKSEGIVTMVWLTIVAHKRSQSILIKFSLIKIKVALNEKSFGND